MKMKILIGVFCGVTSAIFAKFFPDFGCAIGWFGCGVAVWAGQSFDYYRLKQKAK